MYFCVYVFVFVHVFVYVFVFIHVFVRVSSPLSPCYADVYVRFVFVISPVFDVFPTTFCVPCLKSAKLVLVVCSNFHPFLKPEHTERERACVKKMERV